jgi:outer membrane biosynthesis protein TonB
MMKIRSRAAFLIMALLMLVFVDAARKSVPLFLLAENVAHGSQAPSEESTAQQELPVVDSNKDAALPEPEPQPADPPEQQGQPPVEHEQNPEPEPEPVQQPSPRQ